ncbi:class III extradiol dioxygenase subunit B-like domain-containing protein [Saccharothrix sp.]|uniref:class III extradiol dioxygenase subunit B-like domain-containing protein n=1 Tax=Saccharothrix sp. TaxID=1873460 RepID=UPI002810C792|nr:class III extradiol dioxygenase subunit B-like domain-containing protein [Saccharothrix sp.]
MISRVAVVPHPPLLVPELVGGAVAETQAVRAACLAAARDLRAHDVDWTAVAADPTGPRVLENVVGSFLGFGVDVPVALAEGASSVEPALPLPALVAGWLREQVGARSVRVHLVPPDLPTAECVALGASLGGRALLVLGDGSHRHGEQAVGRPDDRAEPFDEAVREALVHADTEALKALDPVQADELGAAGRAAWQVLAGVPGAWRCTRSEFSAPFGVGYHVAVWEA